MLTDYLHRMYGGQKSRLLTINGKTMRDTIPKGLTRGMHLLTLYLPAEDITPKQVNVADKTNEIGAAKDNQPILRADVKQFFKPAQDAAGWHVPPLPRTIATINNFVIGLAIELGFKNLAEARRTFDGSIASQLLGNF